MREKCRHGGEESWGRQRKAGSKQELPPPQRIEHGHAQARDRENDRENQCFTHRQEKTDGQERRFLT